MSLFRQRLLQSYQIATLKWRERIAEDLRVRHQMPAAILFYHRVAEKHFNPWSISNDDFKRHLDWLSNNVNFVSLQEIQLSQAANVRSEMEVAITFDDGYRENLDRALPELIQRQIPCTYFVTTGHVESETPFPHDLKNGRPLPVHNQKEIRQIADYGIEIGCHTETHLDLGLEYDRDRLLREIRDSRHRLQDWSGQSVDYFAFPYGLPENISQAAIDIVLESGFKGFVSAYGGWNWPGEDDFHLQRIHGDPGIASLTNWLTLDPRKLRRGSRVLYTKNTSEQMVACN